MIMLGRYLLIILAAIFVLSGCDSNSSPKTTVKDSSPFDSSVLVRNKALQAGVDCTYGGVEIYSGFDENGNLILDEEEINDTRVICNGEPGLTSLVEISHEPPGDNCEHGGKRMDSGLDTNRDGLLCIR